MDFKNQLNRIWSRAPGKNQSEFPGLYHTNPRLDPVRVIAKAAASVAWNLYDKTDLRKNNKAAAPIYDHPLRSLMDMPMPTFPDIDEFMLLYLTFAHVELVGEFLWLKVRQSGPGSNVIALQPVLSSWVSQKPTVGNHNFLIYPYGVTAGIAMRVPPEDVVWFKDADLTDPYSNGRGSSEAISDEVQTDEYASKYQKNFFFNDAQPPFALMTEGTLTQPQAEAVKKSWLQAVGGWIQARIPAVLGGKWTIQKLTDSVREMDMVESRKFLRDETLQHYQIPPEIFGIIENSNRATIDSSFYLFNKNVLSYRLRAIERAITRQLVQVDYDSRLVFKFEEVVQEDEDFALKLYGDGLSKGVVMIDEWRTRFGLPELPNGKGQIFLRPFSALEVGMNESAPTPEPKPEPAPSAIPDDTTLEISEEPKMVLQIQEKSATKENPRFVAAWKAFDAKATSKEATFKRSVSKIVTIQSKRMKDVLGTADMTAEGIKAALANVFTDAEDKAVKSSLAPAWIDAMHGGADHARALMGKALGSKAPEDALGAMFNKWVESHGLMKAKQINETTYDTLRRNLMAQLAEGIAHGDSRVNLVKRLMETCDGVYEAMDKVRAELIARTESASSVNFGTIAQYKEEGVQTKTWVTTRDDRTREAHDEADGQTVNIDDPFIIDGEEMDYPGDPSALAENVCNCRCTTVGDYKEAGK